MKSIHKAIDSIESRYNDATRLDNVKYLHMLDELCISDECIILINGTLAFLDICDNDELSVCVNATTFSMLFSKHSDDTSENWVPIQHENGSVYMNTGKNVRIYLTMFPDHNTYDNLTPLLCGKYRFLKFRDAINWCVYINDANLIQFISKALRAV